MRLVVGVTLITNSIQKFQTGQSIESTILTILIAGDSALLVVGLWTPVAGFLVAILALWGIFAQHANLCPSILSATIGAGLALVGPGMWSLDARLFGWKRIDLED
jgi:putative oxidoreductase